MKETQAFERGYREQHLKKFSLTAGKKQTIEL